MMKRLFISGIAVSVLTIAADVTASDDAYLKMLEGEAESLELDQTGQLHKESTAAAVRQQKSKAKSRFDWIDDEKLPEGLQQSELEQILQDNFYGTYVFYKKLNSADRQTVFNRYTKAETTDLENVRKNILNLLKQ